MKKLAEKQEKILWQDGRSSILSLFWDTISAWV